MVCHRAVATRSIDKSKGCHRVAIGGKATIVAWQVTLRTGVIISELTTVVEGEVQSHRTVATKAVECIGTHREGITLHKSVARPTESVTRRGNGIAMSDGINRQVQRAEAVATIMVLQRTGIGAAVVIGKPFEEITLTRTYSRR